MYWRLTSSKSCQIYDFMEWGATHNLSTCSLSNSKMITNSKNVNNFSFIFYLDNSPTFWFKHSSIRSSILFFVLEEDGASDDFEMLVTDFFWCSWAEEVEAVCVDDKFEMLVTDFLCPWLEEIDEPARVGDKFGVLEAWGVGWMRVICGMFSFRGSTESSNVSSKLMIKC